MISITESIYNLALRLGVEFYFDTPVSEIIIESNNVKGIKVKIHLLFRYSDIKYGCILHL